MGGGFSCTAKGEIKAGDKFNISGEIQMDTSNKEDKKDKEKEDEE